MTHYQQAHEMSDIVNETEQAVLGILLKHPKRIDDVRDILRPDMFTDALHVEMFGIITDQFSRGSPVDFRTIQPLINDASLWQNNLEKSEYIAGLMGSFVLETEARNYAKHIASWHKDRVLRAVMTGAGTDKEKAAKISELWREIGVVEGSEIVSLNSALDKTYEEIEDVYRRGGGLAGLSTGLVDIDNALCGLEDGGLYVIAGRPAMGKTAAALTIAMNAATKGNPVLFFSLEMSTEQLVHRVNARYANVSMWSQKANPIPGDFSRLDAARKELSKAPLSIIDRAGLTSEQIVAKAHQAAKIQRPRLIIIDHLGIVAARDVRSPRVYQVAEMTMAFKALAKDLQCPVIVLHQLNRGVEGRDDKRPSLSDLRDSGSVEQDADAVILLYRAEYYLKNREPSEQQERDKWHRDLNEALGMADLIIAKNRQGESKNVRVRFDAQRQVFENMGY